MLSWSAVADLAAEGIEMGAHTVRHPQLDAIPREDAESEIAESKAELEHHLGQQVVSFAYPHGYHDRHVHRLVVDAGFTSASAVKHAFSSRVDDRFALSRVMVRRGDDAATVARWARGEGLPTSTGGRPSVASAVWRQARRARARVRPTGAAA
jgi:peptidoglycan/xylan/chitin deacetylase (PgdA/CDA1 family)